jgi:hypothetical protein
MFVPPGAGLAQVVHERTVEARALAHIPDEFFRGKVTKFRRARAGRSLLLLLGRTMPQ